MKAPLDQEEYRLILKWLGEANALQQRAAEMNAMFLRRVGIEVEPLAALQAVPISEPDGTFSLQVPDASVKRKAVLKHEADLVR
jgi:hypothetical protein